MQDIVIGVDVGTGSARAGAFTLDGRMLAQAAHPIRLWQPRPDFAQQSSADIWTAVCRAVREVLAGRAELCVRGIGFDATCSLVALDAGGGPVSVSPDGETEQDVVVWMDHRAAAEAEAINAGSHEVLRHVGGRISLEMQVPKLLWLKHHLPVCWRRAAHFLDLPDFLTWRATGSLTRSLCSTVCKWTYRGEEGRWDEGFFRAIGLEDLAEEGFRRIGTAILPVGAPVPGGLGAMAAAELGLPPGTPVVTPVPAAREDLKPGAAVMFGATRDAEGQLTATRVTVAKDGVSPPN